MDTKIKQLVLKTKPDFDALAELKPETMSVKAAVQYRNELQNEIWGQSEQLGSCLPWSYTHQVFRFRRGEITIWSGINGHKKSMVTTQAFLQFIRQKEKVAIASFELPPKKTLRRMAYQAVSCKPSEEYIDKFFSFVFDNVWLWDHYGSVPHRRVIGFTKYCFETLKVNHVLIDSLMKIDIAEDNYTVQKNFINDLCAIAKHYEGHIHLVTHHSKNADENNMSTLSRNTVYGTGRIVDQVDNHLIVWWNAPKARELEKPSYMQDEAKLSKGDFYIIVDKQRYGEWEGLIKLWFHRDSLQMIESENGKPTLYV